jgi:hypothetical protein
MIKKIMNIILVQHLWLVLNQDRTDHMLLLNIEYLWKQLDHKKNILKNEYGRHEVMCETRW